MPERAIPVRRKAGRALLVAVLAAAAGCAEAPEPIDRAVAEAVLLENLNAANEVELALERVSRLCLEELGFTVHPAGLEYPDAPDLEHLLGAEVYSAPDPSLPPPEIYGVVVDSPSITLVVIDEHDEGAYTEPNPFNSQTESERDAYFTALYGSSEMEPEVVQLPDLGQSERAGGGCMREAEDAISGGAYPDYLNQAGLAGARGGTNWQSDERVQTARFDWAACMDARGYDFESPLALRGSLSNFAGDLKAEWQIRQAIGLEEAEAELAAAVVGTAEDDAACHEESGLQEAQETVFWEYLIAYVSANETAFYEFQERAEAMTAQAQEILASGRLLPHPESR
ncbi:hypothetical protein [Glycomyces sp. NRRL B-16210]|uniref:hypothetical protein n=1 Tax=Glycomyces sp. NRRL B-16210 TaxID=1463821 RepID=UPI00055874F2|nr:hypothetical protein [Glycomyces sp. NRRL B-16210]